MRYLKVPTVAFFFVMVCFNSVFSQQSDNSKILWTANWSHDNKYIAVGGYNNTLIIYNGVNFNLIRVC